MREAVSAAAFVAQGGAQGLLAALGPWVLLGGIVLALLAWIGGRLGALVVALLGAGVLCVVTQDPMGTVVEVARWFWYEVVFGG